MVNNQEWFNSEYPKAEKEIKLKYEDFQGQLSIENYLQLEKLNLRDVESIEKVSLKNLPQLQECILWNCGLQDLIVKNCPQLKTLNVRSNSLINSGFLENLESLEKLELDGNTELTELIEILKDYRGNWKICKRFLDLQKSKDQLKEFLKKEVLKPLGELSEKAEKSENFSEPGNTDELKLITKKDIEKVREINEKLETELVDQGSKIQKLEKELAETEKKLTNTQGELEAQQLALENLEQKLKKAPSDGELQEKVKKYKTKVKELEKKINQNWRNTRS